MTMTIIMNRTKVAEDVKATIDNREATEEGAVRLQRTWRLQRTQNLRGRGGCRGYGGKSYT